MASANGWQRLSLPVITLEDLDRIRRFVHAAVPSHTHGEITDAVVLALDEVCANLAMHGYADRPAGGADIAIQTGPDSVRVVVEDAGMPFHPDEAPEPDLGSAWETKRVGGLGWFFVRQLMDECTYETANGRNRLTLVKKRDRSMPGVSDSTNSTGDSRE
ncbi:MAG TPA: ATP-binding protein [Gemmatimonas sp.]|nr:ATP-binding protein [Gemmatimonas sp.]